MERHGGRTWTRRQLVGALGATVATTGCLSADNSNDLAPTATADLSAPVRGAADAPVTVAVFEDFVCPACRQFTARVEPQIRSEYVEPGTVRYEFHDFPLDTHAPDSYEAASAARAVQSAGGDEGFFEFAALLFANQRELGPDLYRRLGDEVGVDGDAVREAATGRTYRHVVGADKRGGLDRGVDATPTVFVDGEAVDGVSWEAVSSAVEAARER